MDLLEDLLEGTPPWAYNDNVDMGQEEDESSAASFAVPSASFPASVSFPVSSASVSSSSGVAAVSPPKESGIAFPPHWAELMEQIRVREEEMKRVMLSRRSSESVSLESKVPPPTMLPVSSYSLLPPQMSASPVLSDSAASFQVPHAAFPHMPFWSAAPLPFSPNVYPVNVLPPSARESVLAPKAPPRPAAADKKKRVGRVKSKTRQRDAKGLFVKSPPQEEVSKMNEAMDNMSLMGRIQELQKQLLESRYESVVLREQLVHSQMELSQLKDRGLVRANLRGYSEPQPVPVNKEAAANSAGWKSTSPPPPSVSAITASAMDAFRVQLDYAQIKSKLRPTNNGHYDADAAPPMPDVDQPSYQWDLSE